MKTIFAILAIALISFCTYEISQQEDKFIVKLNRDDYQLSRYQEVKHINTDMDFDGTEEKKEKRLDTIVTDFVFGLKKQSKIGYFLGSESIYEAYVLVLKSTFSSQEHEGRIFGYDLFGDEKDETAPVCKITFNE